MTDFSLNGELVTASSPGEAPLLWVVRDEFGLKGAKYGCGAGLCGACTVLLNGTAVRSCVTPLSQAAGADVTTIEGLGTPAQPHPLQQRWAELGVPQCGYCQPGQIVSAEALLRRNPEPTRSEVDEAMAGNLCRCGCYQSIRQAILDVAGARVPENAVEGPGA